MTLGRIADGAGIAAFLLTELLALFASDPVPTFRCCSLSDIAASATGVEALAVFAVVMAVPAALVGLGAALMVNTLGRAFTANSGSRSDAAEPDEARDEQ